MTTTSKTNQNNQTYPTNQPNPTNPTPNSQTSDFPLTALHLTLTCEAFGPMQFDGFRTGGQLRGALLGVMSRAICAGDPRDPEHVRQCPVCWLVAANEKPGEERRGYALMPPIDTRPTLQSGQRFEFGLTLFGQAQRYLPYFLIALPEAGRAGIGRLVQGQQRDHPGQRGQFSLRKASALNPFVGREECVLAEGEQIVHVLDRPISHADVLQASGHEPLDGPPVSFNLNFLTPTRLIVNERLLKAPDFGAIFKHVLRRLDDLAGQFADHSWRRPMDEVQSLQAHANNAQLVEARTRWVEEFSGSRRTNTYTPIGGFVGSARYIIPADSWHAILPWLLWGQVVQVGKNTVKGDGVFRVERG